MNEVEQPPNQALIDHLEGLLEGAKNGTLQGIATALQYRDRETDCTWILPEGSDTSKLRSVALLSAELQRIQFEIFLADPAWCNELRERIVR